ncbi:uncharacterized protein LOC106174685 [Lingula anatina]|uniref:Uncharacterized protein LOC106174685 n=1 Tax=Lingula anatina TaxID=7574 RepID=A0A1S3JN50_LINAN|nr:uncharacterized protein LOC106174685 [Lingula anatina]|eukprot:XP_013411798.1 uncharacterized protein LOC106174685 [Lingula anatina]
MATRRSPRAQEEEPTREAERPGPSAVNVSSRAPPTPPPPPPPPPSQAAEGPRQPGHQVILSLPQHLSPFPFRGDESENAEEWMGRYEEYCQVMQYNLQMKLSHFAYLLMDNAKTWYSTLDGDTKADFEALKRQFLTRYGPSPATIRTRTAKLFSCQQGNTKIRDYLAKMTKMGREVGLPEQHIVAAVVNGLDPSIRTAIIMKNPQNLRDLQEAATLADAASACSPSQEPAPTVAQTEVVNMASVMSQFAEMHKDIMSQLSQLVTKCASVQAVTTNTNDRKVSFQAREDNRSQFRQRSRERSRERESEKRKCNTCVTQTGDINLILIILMMLATVPVTLADRALMNYGLMLHDKGTVRIVSDYWLHSMTIHIPDIPSESAYDLDCEGRVDDKTCVLVERAISEGKRLYSQTAAELRALHHKVDMTFKTPSRQLSREKRSVLPFVGNIAKSLFGVATESQVNKVIDHMNILQARQQKALTTFSKFSRQFGSIFHHQNLRLTNIVKEIAANHHLGVMIGGDLKLVENEMEFNFKLITKLMHLSTVTAKLNQEISSTVIGLNDLTHGKLSPVLFPPQVLASTLKHIQTALQQHGKHYSIQQDMQYYYQYAKFATNKMNDSIIVTLKIPIFAPHNSFQVFETEVFKIPFNATSNHSSLLTNIPEYFGKSSSAKAPITFSRDFLDECTGNKIRLCEATKLKPAVNYDCIQAILEENKPKVKEICHFKFLPNSASPSVKRLGKDHIIISKIYNLTFECATNTTVTGCDFCIMTVPCSCTIKHSTFFLPPQEICETSSDVEVLHPINLAVIQHFFDSQNFSHLLSHSSFSTPPIVDIPTIKLFAHNFSKFVNQDSEIQMDLKEAMKAAKKGETIFQSLTEPLLSGDLQLPKPDMALKEIVAYVALGLACLGILFTFSLAYKLKILGTTMLTIGQARATPAPIFVYKLTTTTQPETTKFDMYEILTAEITPTVYFMATLMLVLSIILWRRCRNRKLKNCLAIEVSNQQMSEIIPLTKIQSSPNEITVRGAPLVKDITLVKGLRPKIIIQWGDDVLVQTCHAKPSSDIQLPVTVYLPLWNYLKLKRLTKVPFDVYLVVIHHKRLVYL